MAKFHMLRLMRKEDMALTAIDDLMGILNDAQDKGACKITFDFKENHKAHKYPTGPIYTIPSLDAVHPKTIYNWFYSAYNSGCAFFRLDFSQTPPDGEPFIYLRERKTHY